MNKMKLAVLLAALLLAVAPQVLAQTTVSPVGSAAEPGSQLLYVLDTGVDAVTMYGADEAFGSKSVGELGSTAPKYQSFISVTNTNPTNAVTVHFRYFNSNCEDVLDFLVVLTCNDTMLVDPFDYVIPGTTTNVSQRFFGKTTDTPVAGIPASQYGDGRFLLFVTASGDPRDDVDDIADTLYPYELVKWADIKHCYDATDETMVKAQIGAAAGIKDTNLHILNASAVAFDHLIGWWTNARVEAGDQASYGLSAWTRPAVSRPDGLPEVGDGNHIAKWTVLSGSENIAATSGGTNYLNNDFYLRQDAFGGNSQNTTVHAIHKIFSTEGAFAWALFPEAVAPANQALNNVSLLDDYNGSNNVSGLAYQDRSYRMDPIVTIYDLTVFNNDEETITIPDPDVIISPPPEAPDELDLVIAVKCLNTWTIAEWNETDKLATLKDNLGDFSVNDLFGMSSLVEDFLTSPNAPVDVNSELGPGWIRFDRVVSTNHYKIGTKEYVIAWDGTVLPSIVTIGQKKVVFESFGFSKWVSSATDDPYLVY